MGQKIHPVGLRLGIIQKHRSRWITRSNRTRWRWLMQDKAIRDYLTQNFKKANIAKILIFREQPAIDRKNFQPANVVKVWIYAEQPIEIGTEQHHLIKLTNQLQTVCSQKQIPGTWMNKPDFRIFPRVYRIKHAEHQANAIAASLINQLEDRTLFRKALKKTIKDLQRMDDKKSKQKPLAVLKGVRIQLSGRLNGAEIARIEWYKQGRVPLQTLRANIDYVSKTAKTTHGILGIKVWAFKGEKTY